MISCYWHPLFSGKLMRLHPRIISGCSDKPFYLLIRLTFDGPRARALSGLHNAIGKQATILIHLIVVSWHGNNTITICIKSERIVVKVLGDIAFDEAVIEIVI